MKRYKLNTMMNREVGRDERRERKWYNTTSREKRKTVRRKGEPQPERAMFTLVKKGRCEKKKKIRDMQFLPHPYDLPRWQLTC
jgi:hypothetical protein